MTAFLESWIHQLHDHTKMSPQLNGFYVYRRIYIVFDEDFEWVNN